MLSLLLLQFALAPGIGDAHAHSRLPSRLDVHGFAIPETESIPYLQVISALPLRFGAPPPPPDLSGKPASGAPPKPVNATEPGPAATLAASSATPTAAVPAAPTASPSPESNPAKTSEATTSATPAPAKPDRSVLSILPDDTPSAPHAEDFLPFFQFPGNARPDRVRPADRAPSPEQLPRSSATYELK